MLERPIVSGSHVGKGHSGGPCRCGIHSNGPLCGYTDYGSGGSESMAGVSSAAFKELWH
jgi:hypothetical protein